MKSEKVCIFRWLLHQKRHKSVSHDLNEGVKGGKGRLAKAKDGCFALFSMTSGVGIQTFETMFETWPYQASLFFPNLRT